MLTVQIDIETLQDRAIEVAYYLHAINVYHHDN